MMEPKKKTKPKPKTKPAKPRSRRRAPPAPDETRPSHDRPPVGRVSDESPGDAPDPNPGLDGFK